MRYVLLATLKDVLKGIVESSFNFRCSVWDSCGMSKLNKLQKSQNRAERIMTNSQFDSSATTSFQDLGWPIIGEHIHRETSVMANKCLTRLAPGYLSGCISKLSDYRRRDLSDSLTDLLITRMKISCGQKAFAFRGTSGAILI